MCHKAPSQPHHFITTIDVDIRPAPPPLSPNLDSYPKSLRAAQIAHTRHLYRAWRRSGLHGACPAAGPIATAVGRQHRLPQLAIASMPKKDGERPNVQKDIPNRPRDLTDVSRAVLRSEQAKRWTKRYRTEVAASSSSLLSTFAAYPLDSVKTRLQAYKFNSFTDCVRHTYKTEGFHGFYRGVWSPLASITLVRTVSFSIYQRTKYALDNWIYQTTGSSPLVIANTRGAWPTLSTVTCFGLAGVNAGAAITLSAQISVLMAERSDGGGKNEAIRKSYQNLGTWKTAQNLVKHRGWGGLYSGFHLHLLRDSIGTGIYFVTYESVKQILANARGTSPTHPLAVVVAGGMCGLVSWACIFPIDTVKSIYQRNCLVGGKDKAIRPKIEFFSRRMYRGLGVSMSRSCMVNAIFFTAFEFLKKRINGMTYDEELLRANDY
ncbi:mitochondrial carrier [Pyrenophora seminiperda CCB06]|uniref:Mitochondrial carrier n=1 Tax=Pyrenophora seminiperda CCB06 TaxID=1302712 RepID=A0A3M7LVG2_9PLEO|nr:mitochondrial carrier [Pyrenophora seminiperda CCB06]